MKHAFITLRKYHQLTQVDLSKKLGVKHQYVSSMETGTKRVNAETFKNLCRIFKLKDTELIHLTGLLNESTRKKLNFLSFESDSKLCKYIEWDLNKL